jgi:uncharacterized membrane protein YgdD (TMEM256/DUF423 family)
VTAIGAGDVDDYAARVRTRFFSVGAAFLAATVAAGALGAHVLHHRLGAHALELWDTAFRYLAIAGLGLLGTGVVAEVRQTAAVRLAGLAIAWGGVLFAATLTVLALGGPRWLGAVTPAGGLLLIAGFTLLAIATWRH